MAKYDNEFYTSKEYSSSKENLIFKAEEFKTLEHIKNTFEDYKSKEVDLTTKRDKPKTLDKKDLNKKIDTIKNGMNSISTAITTSVVAVGAVGLGVITIAPQEKPIPEEIMFGEIEPINYYVDYTEENGEMINDVRIYFDIKLDDGFYASVTNKNTNESKVIETNEISFSNIGDLEVEFSLKVFNDSDEIVDESSLKVNPLTEYEYLGLGEMDYIISTNEDESKNLSLIIGDESHIKAYLTDNNNLKLNYDYSVNGNIIEIKNIVEKEINIKINSYYLVDGNYYNKKTYCLNNFNLENPSYLEIQGIEILNSSFSFDGTIPTIIHLNGHLIGSDYAELIVLDEMSNELENLTNITNLSEPIILYDLPTDSRVTFKYRIYNNENILSEEMYQTLLSLPEEYSDIIYDFYGVNPGDGYITYNDDQTYNYYSYTGFNNNSEYDLIYKLELVVDMIPKYDYWGTDEVAIFTNVKPDVDFSLVNKIFVRDGINYYAINNFYLASGSVSVYTDEDGKISIDPISVYNLEDKIYAIDIFAEVNGDVIAEVILSTGQVIDYKFTSDEVMNTAMIDLTDYTFDSITIKVKASCDPNYSGIKDMILETGMVPFDERFITVETIYSE